MKLPATAALAILLVAACADDPTTPADDGAGLRQSVAFPTSRDGQREIYLMNPDGGGQTRLTFHPADDFIPAWSPNRRQIVFTSNRDGNSEIYLMNADGGNQLNLTHHAASDNAAVFSPDGKRIAFHSLRDGNPELYLMNPDGSGQARLTQHPGLDQWPDWSPDGRQIVFQRDGDIFVLTVATGATTQLTTHSALDDMPVFSPNGRQVAFLSRRDGYAAIYVMEADGRNPANLTPRPAGETVSNWAMFPEWSANGRQIYFQAYRPETGPESDVYAMNADGSNVMRLTTDPAFDGAPAAR